MGIAFVIGSTALLGCVTLGLGLFVLGPPQRSSAIMPAQLSKGTENGWRMTPLCGLITASVLLGYRPAACHVALMWPRTARFVGAISSRAFSALRSLS
jgi:hypothetical protein